jgi:hypothetical protein
VTEFFSRGGRFWYKAPNGRRPYEQRKCSGCGADFYGLHTPSAPQQGRFCSLRCSRLGAHNPAWRGDAIGYRGAHLRVEKERGKAAMCSVRDCDTGCTTFHWANLTGNYGDVWDYAPMCVTHHRRLDHGYGERHGGAKLTDAQVAEMRAAYARGGVTQRELAGKYRVSQSCVGKIIRNQTRGIDGLLLARHLPKGGGLG